MEYAISNIYKIKAIYTLHCSVIKRICVFRIIFLSSLNNKVFSDYSEKENNDFKNNDM